MNYTSVSQIRKDAENGYIGKIKAIKAYRQVTGADLRTSKETVEGWAITGGSAYPGAPAGGPTPDLASLLGMLGLGAPVERSAPEQIAFVMAENTKPSSTLSSELFAVDSDMQQAALLGYRFQLDTFRKALLMANEEVEKGNEAAEELHNELAEVRSDRDHLQARVTGMTSDADFYRKSRDTYKQVWDKLIVLGGDNQAVADAIREIVVDSDVLTEPLTILPPVYDVDIETADTEVEVKTTTEEIAS